MSSKKALKVNGKILHKINLNRVSKINGIDVMCGIDRQSRSPAHPQGDSK